MRFALSLPRMRTRAPVPVVQLNPGAPLRLDEVVNKALAKDAKRRYQDAIEFADALKSALAVTMFEYSAMKKSENFIALYSVWYPAMSSDSTASARKGIPALSPSQGESPNPGRLKAITSYCGSSAGRS